MSEVHAETNKPSGKSEAHRRISGQSAKSDPVAHGVSAGSSCSTNDKRAAAEEYCSQGLAPIPLSPGSKACKIKGWKEKPFGPADFTPQSNIALRHDNGLVDVDLDWPEARDLACDVLQPSASCGRTYGGKSATRSHFFYTCKEPPKSTKFDLPASCKGDSRFSGEHALVVMEVRAGESTMVPPSIHPCGEPIVWCDPLSEIGTITSEYLKRSCGLLAFLAVCVRCYPGSGTRNDACQTISAVLVRSGCDPVDADIWTKLVANHAGDEEAELRGGGKAAREKLGAGKEVTGLPRLCELLALPADMAGTLAKWLQQTQDALATEAEAAVERVNQEHAVVSISGQTSIANFGPDGDTFSRKSDFELRLANQFITDPNTGKPASLAKVWLSHPRRRQFLNGVVFAPGCDGPPGTLNLWRGFAVKSCPGDWVLLRQHIFENVCSGNQEYFDYFLNWCARMVQGPKGPCQVAIVMRGKKGSGKGTLGRWLGRALGRHFFHATMSDYVTGKFNSHLLITLLLFADEALFAADPRSEKLLNGMITEEMRTSEQKFMPAITVKNFLHLLMATNSHWAVPATDDERRYFVLDVSDAHVQDLPYFAAIDKQMESGGVEGMLHELLNRDISKFEVRQVPRTAALAEQQIQTFHGRGEVRGWLIDVFTAEKITVDDIPYHFGETGLELSKADAKKAYDAWAKPFGRRPIESNQFGRELRAALGGALDEKRRRTGAGAGGRPESYIFPQIDECRSAFERAMNVSGLWETP